MLSGEELKGIILTKHVSRIEEMRIVGAYLIKKRNGKKSLGRHIRRCECDFEASIKYTSLRLRDLRFS